MNTYINSLESNEDDKERCDLLEEFSEIKYNDLPEIPGKNRWDIFMLASDESMAGGGALICAIISPIFLLFVGGGLQAVLDGYASNPGILPEAMLKWVESFGTFFTYMPLMGFFLFLLKFIFLHKKRSSIINSLEESRISIYKSGSRGSMWAFNPLSWPFQITLKTTVIFNVTTDGYRKTISVEIESLT